MNIFFLHMSPKTAARMHANIHVVKMIVETAQLLCNVHHRQREICLPPYISRKRIPYKESAAGHRKLGSMIWVTESLGNYRWAVQLGLELCKEYNKGRARAAGKTSKHKTQRVLEWLRNHEPSFQRTNRTPVRQIHLAMPNRFKKATSSVQAYRDYYYSKRRTMKMEWPRGRVPDWWEAKRSPKKRKQMADAEKQRAKAKRAKLRAEQTDKLNHDRELVVSGQVGSDVVDGPTSVATQAIDQELQCQEVTAPTETDSMGSATCPVVAAPMDSLGSVAPLVATPSVQIGEQML